MLRQLIPVLLLLPSLTFANTLEDVIYKKDGSVLRGTLIEQDFEKGTYKIEINGGSVFVIQKADVSKITKEANQSVVNTPSSSQTITPVINTPTVSPNYEYVQDHNIEGVMYIGIIGRVVTLAPESPQAIQNKETEYYFQGINIAGQKNFNQHIAFYVDMNIADLSEAYTRDRFGNEQVINKSSLLDARYISSQFGLTISTNHYQGWQFFTGVGHIKERFNTEDDKKSFEGQVYHLGTGYSWKAMQVLFRINLLDADYPDDHIDNTNSSLQLGFNF